MPHSPHTECRSMQLTHLPPTHCRVRLIESARREGVALRREAASVDLCPILVTWPAIHYQAYGRRMSAFCVDPLVDIGATWCTQSRPTSWLDYSHYSVISVPVISTVDITGTTEAPQSPRDRGM